MSILQYVRYIEQTTRIADPKAVWRANVAHDRGIGVVPNVQKFDVACARFSVTSTFYTRNLRSPLIIYHLSAYSKNESIPAPIPVARGLVHAFDLGKHPHCNTALLLTPVQVLTVFPTNPTSDLRFHRAKKAL